jgi:hypothetical protein
LKKRNFEKEADNLAALKNSDSVHQLKSKVLKVLKDHKGRETAFSKSVNHPSHSQ